MSVRLTLVAVGLVVLSTLAIADEWVLFGQAIVEPKDIEQLSKHCSVLPPRSIPVVDSVLPASFSFIVEISKDGIRPLHKKSEHPSIRIIAQWYADRCVLRVPIRGKRKFTISCTDSIFSSACRFFTDLDLKSYQLAWNYPGPVSVVRDTNDSKIYPELRPPSHDENALALSIKYPEEARRINLEGMVLVGALLSETGCLEKIQIIESDNTVFDQSAIDAVRRVKFTPAFQNGKPVRCWVRVPIKFSLHD
ncbi:MAG: energy transducer TonB [Candidatus Kapabacteria bacterium]|nr:energy transducer TonB [Ignavibacteria bacterium]MBK7412268.1 energy transducer TonB [Ignavibacteria bacterium]MBP6510154.1 energy transducer TonB [Candidatus Kapabacteria bacterium]MBP7093770.1 energy transducer TonB [Candidatus Kapabacteria bacterium]